MRSDGDVNAMLSEMWMLGWKNAWRYEVLYQSRTGGKNLAIRR